MLRGQRKTMMPLFPPSSQVFAAKNAFVTNAGPGPHRYLWADVGSAPVYHLVYANGVSSINTNNNKVGGAVVAGTYSLLALIHPLVIQPLAVIRPGELQLGAARRNPP